MKNKRSTMNQSIQKTQNSIDTLIGEDTILDGNLRLKGNIIIYGKINGDVETEGSITIAPGAIITGQLNANLLQIGGRVKGDIHASGKAILGEKSHLEGDIVASNLIIKEGARFEGKCDMSKKDHKTKQS